MKETEWQIEELEQYAKKAKSLAEKYGMEKDSVAADQMSLHSALYDCTVAICHHLADLTVAIREGGSSGK